jgi:cell division protein FtsB
MKGRARPSRVAPASAAEKPRSPWRFRPAYLLLVAIMGLFAYAYLQKTQEISRLSVEQAALAARNHQLVLDNQRTSRENRYYATKRYEVEAARSIGYSAPGETPVQIGTIKPPAVVSAPRHVTVPALSVKPVWQQWWDAFFD